MLDPADFPNGNRFFKKRAQARPRGATAKTRSLAPVHRPCVTALAIIAWQCARAPALVHNNYAIGQRTKKRRFIKTQLWLVNSSLTLAQMDQNQDASS